MRNIAQCFKCGRKGFTLKVWKCRMCGKNACQACFRILPTIRADFYNKMRNEQFSSLTQQKHVLRYQQWVANPNFSKLNLPIFFCSDRCVESFIHAGKAHNYEFIRDQIDTIIPVTNYLSSDTHHNNPILTYIIRDAMTPNLQITFDEVVNITLKTDSFFSEREAKIQMAKNLELAYRLEDAAKVYEGLEMYEEAGRLRKQLTRQTTMTVDLNRLLEQLKKGGISTNFNCHNCGASIPIDGKTDPQGLRFCNFCGSAIKTHDLVEVIQKVI